LIDFSSFRFLGVEYGPVSDLRGTRVLGIRPYSMLDVCQVQSEWPAVIANASERNMNVGELRIIVNGGDPFQPRAKVHFHLLNHFPRQLFQIQPFAKLWGEDHFE
jgi:hypothetical protein